MGAAESKSDGLDDVQEQLKVIRAQEAILLKKMNASRACVVAAVSDGSAFMPPLCNRQCVSC